ncbi:MAG: hypothetical protein IKM59_00380 [Oscillospiraceae bacterium]|nr:hypothetical protein [Oscillospiraceae bacterium]
MKQTAKQTPRQASGRTTRSPSSQTLKANARRRNKSTSPWIKYCALGAVILLVIAGCLYAFRYMSLDREFHHNLKFFSEETYKEIFALKDTKDKAASLMETAEEAFSFVGTPTEAGERFGLLGRYSCTDTKAVAEEHELDYIISNIGEKEGHIWVAYWQAALDPGGEAISASGSEKQRILSRWTVKLAENRTWIVTEILEGP